MQVISVCLQNNISGSLQDLWWHIFPQNGQQSNHIIYAKMQLSIFLQN